MKKLVARVVSHYKRLYWDYKWSEKKITRGNGFPEKEFLLVRREAHNYGLFSLFNVALGWIRYADENGMIPVIDMQNYKSIYLEKDKYKKENAWEYFFEQPFGIGVSDIKRAKNITLCEARIHPDFPGDNVELLNNVDGKLDDWKNICKKYIHIKKNIQDEIESEWNQLVSEDDKVLGIFCRGTDYIEMRPKGHPMQPSVEQIIDHVSTLAFQIDKIFVVTEDKKIVEKLQKEFGDKIILNKKNYVDYNGGYIGDYKSDRANDSFLRGKEYLASIVMLSKCNYLVASRASGVVGAELFSDGWEYHYIFDLGCYPVS